MFRFTIRDVLWLLVAVALAVGWHRDHGRVALENGRIRMRLLATELHLEAAQSVLKEHGLKDPGGYYP